MRYVEVVWDDAHTEPSNANTWFLAADITDEPYRVHTVGHLIPDAKEGHITIAQSVSYTDALLDSVLHIPKGMIHSMRTLS